MARQTTFRPGGVFGRIVTGLFVALAASGHSTASGQSVVTSSPPQIVFVPLTNAVEVIKHPTLPALYVGCRGEPESKNLVTFQLNADGTIITNTRTACDNYFTADGKNPTNACQVLRPAVAADLNILYVGVVPANMSLASNYFASASNNQFAVVSLDEQGQPKKLLKAFRGDLKDVVESPESLTRVTYEPVSRRLFLVYLNFLGWCGMDKDGLPQSGKVNMVPGVARLFDWEYAPEWQRFYARSYTDPNLTVFKLTADGLGLEFIQTIAMDITSPRATLAVSVKFHKVYVAAAVPEKRMAVLRVTREGRITGMPRFFPMAENTFARFDFKANLIYAFTAAGVLNVYKLDPEGFPAGSPATFQLGCGEVRDAFLDEATGKVYVTCSQPPGVKH